jgi:putative heme-binding domain-containing protein
VSGIFCNANDTFNSSKFIGNAAKSLSAAQDKMTDIGSHTTNWSGAVFTFLSTRRILCAAIASVFFSACALVLHAGAQNRKSPANESRAGRTSAEDGRKAFESVCASCHGLDGRGGERGPNIATRAAVQQLSDEETLRVLRSGIPAAGMPAFSALGVPKIKAVIIYLRILQGGGKAASIPGNAQQGKLLFFGKAGCAKCHMINGSGGFIGADLSSYGLNGSAEEIRAAIIDPNKDPDRRERTVLVTTREGRQFTGVARNEDNFSLQLQSLDGTFHLFSKADIDQLEFLPKSLMPSDYGSALGSGEMDDLVSYLVRTARATRQMQASETESKREKEDD